MTDAKHDTDSLEMQIFNLTMKARKLEAQLECGLDADELDQLASQQSNGMADLAQYPATSPNAA
jgi:hypothetical protein